MKNLVFLRNDLFLEFRDEGVCNLIRHQVSQFAQPFVDDP